MDFTGKTVVITGAASGMGAASAREFSKLEAKVVIVDRNHDLASAVASEIKADPPLLGDVSDSDFCRQTIRQVLDRHGRLDVLVNCAGVIHRADALGTSDEHWAEVMATNVNGVFYMSREAIGPMKKQGGGAIVNFGSIWGNVGAAGVLAYCASKGAVHQITRAMALDHVRDGIRINAVCPGEVNTPMLASQRPAPPTPADLQKLAEETIPMARLAEPVEIAKVVVFLASEDASYMTGALVTVDAGYTAR
ncbi:SDR family oxidoreductase [bacterium]|nr:SDR family oxidoreductase [bacterium]